MKIKMTLVLNHQTFYRKIKNIYNLMIISLLAKVIQIIKVLQIFKKITLKKMIVLI